MGRLFDQNITIHHESSIVNDRRTQVYFFKEKY